MADPRASFVTRRSFLAAALGVVGGVAGCGQVAQSTAQSPANTAVLVSAKPFYIAHRGGGADWPEMTAYAYDQAVQLPGLKAIEISVCATSDGVLVCNHDATTLRLSGVNYTIAEETWATISKLMISAAYTKDPTQPARPIARLEEVLDAHLSTTVAFVEPKNPQAVEPLMAAMVAIKQPERVVWKQPINQPNFARAKANGFSTWGYVLNEPGHLGARLAKFAAAPEIDRLGAPRYENDQFVSNIVNAARANRKQVIMWNIRTVADRARALSLGCQGLMTSDISGVMSAPLTS